eukprot:GHVN01024368.1.p1 GENE.GHVN01024368.1~~GHVN01024368.1.p1  ORF type:complete len:901 (+),score=126.10 GHVN01024368.1:1378-4080(+)
MGPSNGPPRLLPLGARVKSPVRKANRKTVDQRTRTGTKSTHPGSTTTFNSHPCTQGTHGGQLDGNPFYDFEHSADGFVTRVKKREIKVNTLPLTLAWESCTSARVPTPNTGNPVSLNKPSSRSTPNEIKVVSLPASQLSAAVHQRPCQPDDECQIDSEIPNEDLRDGLSSGGRGFATTTTASNSASEMDMAPRNIPAAVMTEASSSTFPSEHPVAATQQPVYPPPPAIDSPAPTLSSVKMRARLPPLRLESRSFTEPTQNCLSARSNNSQISPVRSVNQSLPGELLSASFGLLNSTYTTSESLKQFPQRSTNRDNVEEVRVDIWEGRLFCLWGFRGSCFNSNWAHKNIREHGGVWVSGESLNKGTTRLTGDFHVCWTRRGFSDMSRWVNRQDPNPRQGDGGGGAEVGIEEDLSQIIQRIVSPAWVACSVKDKMIHSPHSSVFFTPPQTLLHLLSSSSLSEMEDEHSGVDDPILCDTNGLRLSLAFVGLSTDDCRPTGISAPQQGSVSGLGGFQGDRDAYLLKFVTEYLMGATWCDLPMSHDGEIPALDNDKVPNYAVCCDAPGYVAAAHMKWLNKIPSIAFEWFLSCYEKATFLPLTSFKLDLPSINPSSTIPQTPPFRLAPLLEGISLFISFGAYIKNKWLHDRCTSMGVRRIITCRPSSVLCNIHGLKEMVFNSVDLPTPTPPVKQEILTPDYRDTAPSAVPCDEGNSGFICDAADLGPSNKAGDLPLFKKVALLPMMGLLRSEMGGMKPILVLNEEEGRGLLALTECMMLSEASAHSMISLTRSRQSLQVTYPAWVSALSKSNEFIEIDKIWALNLSGIGGMNGLKSRLSINKENDFPSMMVEDVVEYGCREMDCLESAALIEEHALRVETGKTFLQQEVKDEDKWCKIYHRDGRPG